MSVVGPDTLSHVMLFTHDVAGTVAFYADTLGFAPGYVSEHYATLSHPALSSGLALHLAEHGSADVGHGPQMYFGVADIDGAVAALRAAGIDATDPRSEGGPRFSMFRDNAGNVVGLQELP